MVIFIAFSSRCGSWSGFGGAIGLGFIVPGIAGQQHIQALERSA